MKKKTKKDDEDWENSNPEDRVAPRTCWSCEHGDETFEEYRNCGVCLTQSNNRKYYKEKKKKRNR